MKNPDIKTRANKIVSVKEEIEHFLNQLGMERGLYELELSLIWKESVGEAIAKYSKAVAIKRNKLFVSVENSVWRYELSTKKEQIIDRFNMNLKKLKDYKSIKEIIFT